MRFIINFFLFGFIFYLIYLFFPDVFFKMVSWADGVYLFLRDLFMQISDRVGTARRGETQEVATILWKFLTPICSGY